MTTDELSALDREWAELAGWKGEPVNRVWVREWPAFSTDPAACFGPGGPWEWLVAQPKFYPHIRKAWTGAPSGPLRKEVIVCETDDRDGPSVSRGSGDTICEAITRCAIKAHHR